MKAIFLLILLIFVWVIQRLGLATWGEATIIGIIFGGIGGFFFREK